MSLIVDGIDLDALNYTIKVPYNGSIMTGGDSLNADLNIFYDVSLSTHHLHRAVLTSSSRPVTLPG
jgi:hypothetical protein